MSKEVCIGCPAESEIDPTDATRECPYYETAVDYADGERVRII